MAVPEQAVSEASAVPSTLKRWKTGIIAGWRSLRDFDDTKHIFNLIDSIDAAQTERNYQRFVASPGGAKLDSAGINFADVLADRASLKKCPEGSLGHAYLSFLDEENLDVSMLKVAEQESKANSCDLDPSRRRYMESGLGIHDLFHVLTGYGRDPLGEACVLAFTAEHHRMKGLGFFSFLLAAREKIANPDINLLGFIGEARRLGRETTWTPEIDWRDHLSSDLNEVRSALGLKEPALFNAYYGKSWAQKPQPRLLDEHKFAA